MSEIDRFDRQSFLGRDSQQQFATFKVGIVGLGGGGSHVVQQLAHIGFKRLVLFDDDIVEEHSLHRLVGARSNDAARRVLKVYVARRLIKGLHPKTRVETYPTKWQLNLPAMRCCNLVISCMDTFSARRDLEAFTRRHLIPLIDIGIDLHRNDPSPPALAGQVILSMPGYPCMQCLGFLSSENLAKEAQRYGVAGGRPQVIWPNAIVASTAVGITVDLITDWTKTLRVPVYLCFDGNRHLLFPNERLKHAPLECRHYPLSNCCSRNFPRPKIRLRHIES